MKRSPRAGAINSRLPRRLQRFFWDYDFAQLRWCTDNDLVIARILASGDWDSICWLMRRMSKPDLRDWITSRRGRGLSCRQLRFWEIIVELPQRQVDRWLADPARRLWENR